MANNAPGLAFTLDGSQNPNGVTGAGKTYAFGGALIQSPTATGTITGWNYVATVNAATANTQTLPNATATDIGKSITVKNLGAGVVTVAIFGGNTISGTIPTLANGDSLTITAISVGVVQIVASRVGTPTSPDLLSPWVASTAVLQYSERSLSINGTNVSILSNAARTTTATFSLAESAFWAYTAQTSLVGFPVSTFVVSGFQILVGGQTWQVNSSRTTTAVFDATEQGFWTAMSLSATGTRVNLADFAVNSVIGTSISTVDSATVLAFTQVTSGVTVTIPAPTNTTLHKTITLEVLPASVNGLTFSLGSTFSLGAGSSQQMQWNGSTWTAISSIALMAEYGEITTLNLSSSSASFTDITASTFTLPSAGVWEAIMNISHGNSSNAVSTFQIVDVTGGNISLPATLLTTSDVAGNFEINDSIVVRLTTTGANTFKVQGKTSAGSLIITAVSSRVSWKKIGGQTPVTGSTVDTLYVTRSGTNQTQASNWASRDIIFNGVSSGNIPYNTTTGVATLTAGKTYNIRAELAWNIGATYNIQWALFDAVTNVQISPTVEQMQAVNTSNNTSGTALDYTITPATNQTVKIRTTAATTMLSGESLRYDLNSFMSITQLGSSAYSGITLIGVPLAGQIPVAQTGGATAIWQTPASITTTSVDNLGAGIVPGTYAVGLPMSLTSLSGNLSITSNSVVLAAGRTYTLSAGVTRLNGASGTSEFSYGWRDLTNSAYLGGEGSITQNTGLGAGGMASAQITPIAPMTVQLWCLKNVNASTIGPNDGGSGSIYAGFANIAQLGATAYSGVTIVGTPTAGQVLVGQTGGLTAVWTNPTTPTSVSVDYIYAKHSVGQLVAVGSPFLFDTVVEGSLTRTGLATFNLIAGRTYRLEGSPGGGGSGRGSFQWRDTTNNVFIGNATMRLPVTDTANDSEESANAITIITPVANITVQFWLTASGNSNTWGQGASDAANSFSFVTIEQLGSNAYSGINISGTGTPGQPLLATAAGASFGNFTGGVTSSAGVLTVVTNANLTGGVTSVGNVATVITNANLSGAVTSTGNVVSIPTLYGTDAGPVGAVASSVVSGITGMSVATTAGTGNVVARANLQALLRPALMCAQATIDLNTLYSAVQAIIAPALSTPATIGTLTLAPGVYDFGAAAVQLTGTLTLSGSATDFWIFKTTAAFATTASNSVITMSGGATSANVFWLIGNNAPSFGANTLFRGTVLNTAAIALAATMTLDGRVLSKAGAISVGAGTLMYVPAGVCTIAPMGVLSTFLAYTILGACGTTSTVSNYGDVGSGNTVPTTWASYGLAGNVYGPTTMAARVSYSLYAAGVLVPYSTRTYDSQTSGLVGVALEGAFLAGASTAIECRQQVVVGSVMVTNKILNVARTS